MKRCEFIWRGRAQQPARMRRIGVLSPFAADDAEGHAA